MRAVAMPTNVRLREYDPLQPDANLTGTADVPHAVAGQLDYFGDNYTSQTDGNRIAGFRKEELQSRQKRFYGTGRVFNLAAGHYFTLEQHGRLDGRYLVTEIRHVGSNFAGASTAQQRLGFDSDTSYRVDFGAIDAEQQFRPARVTPVPRIYGVEEAVICGAASSPYAQIDAHGRYKVKIHFDEGDLVDGKASTWVRMIQPHGGNPEGHHFPLRKGTEVLLVYLGGDPDRPVIAGAAHNTNKPSVVTESNHTLNVIHTGSDNRIEMEDTQGAQYIDISTPPQNTQVHLGATHGPHTHNWVVTTDGTGLLHTGGNHDVTVGGDMTEDVVGDLTEDYHSNQTTHVVGDFTETVDGSETRTVSSGSTETIHAGHTQTIDGGSTEKVTGDHARTVVGNVTKTVTGNVTETVTGTVTETFTGGITTVTPATYKIVATAGMQVIAPGGWQLIAPGGTTTVDSFFDKTGGKNADAFAFKMSVVGAKVDIVGGLAASYTAIKMDMTQLKIEYNPVKVANKATELKTVGQVIEAGFLALHGVAFCMIT
jgi:type VI secretion system secreted protein VgrG